MQMWKRILGFFSIMALTSMVLLLLTMLAGCKGDTGATGATGAPGAVGPAPTQCDACHHLNNLVVNEFQEIFISGLAGSDQSVTAGSTATLAFVASKLPAGETAQSYSWTRTNGLAATIATPAASSTNITLPAAPDYKQELVRHVKGLLITDLAGTVLSDRTSIVPVNPLNHEEAFAATFKLRVATTSGKFYWSQVNVIDTDGEAAVDAFSAVGAGISNVPLNVPVLLRATTNAAYNWSFTAQPGGSAAVLNDPLTQLADFTPDVAGQYVVTDGNGNTLNIYAENWIGAITGQNAAGRPLSADCTGCHAAGALDKFTPWMNSGHAEILTQNINDVNSHWTVSGCGPCHSVGYDTTATNNGFDEAVTATGWTFTSGNPNNWTNMLNNFAPAARLANIQCENCHGPNGPLPSGGGSALHTNGIVDPERVSLSADVCGACHGEPARHARFQQWEDSGHGNYALAVEEGTGANCAGCHSGQGFMIWLTQLQAGDPRRGLTSPITWTADTVLPQTCSVCHDPHAQGTTSGEPNTATVRVENNTPKLPGGFMATGVGRGAVCIICHNTRNGGVTGQTDTFLHQDGDPFFGTLTSYAAPHVAAQGDMLMGYNAYGVGSGFYRSPHSLITDTCVNCHMELTPPPALLSYNLAGTNHSFKASLNICSNCHTVNQALGPMLQATVTSTLEVLKASIEAKVVSRNTNPDPNLVIVQAHLKESHGRPVVDVVYFNGTTAADVRLDNIPGVAIADLGTDALAKAIWNFLLVEGDGSFGIHNPDYTFAVLGAAQFAVDSIPNEIVPSNEL